MTSNNYYPKIYKIRHKGSGKYISNVLAKKLTKVGKNWSRKGDIFNQIRGAIKASYLVGMGDSMLKFHLDCEIVSFSEGTSEDIMVNLNRIIE